MPAVVGTPVPRGNGGPAGDLVEVVPVVGYKGFNLQLTTAGQAAAGAPGMVAAVAVAGAAPVNLAAIAGGLPSLMNGAAVQVGLLHPSALLETALPVPDIFPLRYDLKNASTTLDAE